MKIFFLQNQSREHYNKTQSQKIDNKYSSSNKSIDNYISPPVVIDIGQELCRIGFAGDDQPQSAFPPIVGRVKMPGLSYEQECFGIEAIALRNIYNLNNPIQNRIVVDQDVMERLLYNCFYNELRVNPEEHPCFMTQSNENTQFYQEKMTKMMFETFDVPKFYLAKTALCSLYASGKTTGIVLDSGLDCTQIVPIFDGCCLNPCILSNNLAGNDLSKYLVKLLQEFGLNFSYDSPYSRVIINEIKEQLCYVSLNYNYDMQNYDIKSYQLPDGNTIGVSDQQFRCTELLFNPALIGKNLPGIHELIIKSISKCDFDLRKDLYNNIVLSGGNTMFPQLAERLSQEIQQLAPFNMKIRVISPPERRYTAWIGGSIMSSLSSFDQSWVQSKEYNEVGPSIVYRKFFG